MVVVETSAVVDYLPDPRLHPRIGDILENDPASLNAPHLIDLEVLSAFREIVFDRRIALARAAELLNDFEALPIERHSHEYLFRRIWELRNNLTAYDASYIALAEFLDAPILTRDRKFARAPGHTARVEYID